MDSDRLKSLESEKNKLYHLSENLKYQEAMNKQRISEFEQENGEMKRELS
jgi:hypothetical protein